MKKQVVKFAKRLYKHPLWLALLGLTAFVLLTIQTFQNWDNPVIPRKLSLTRPKFAPLPVAISKFAPAVSANNIFILDQASKVVLYQKAADAQIFPASTTKMMTALVALEKYDLNQIFAVTKSYPMGQHIGFVPGEKISVEQLLYAMLVQSGNDAAEILAENFPDGGRQAFINAMNSKAKVIHLNNTHFVNPSGVDEEGHYSSAADLVRLADYALRFEEFARIVATENAVVSSDSKSHIVNNVNQLLGKIMGVKGVKTGYTEGAGQALVTLVDRDNHPVILVVLESKDRFTDSSALIEWVYSNFQWTNSRVDTSTQ